MSCAYQRKTLNQVQGDVFECSYQTVRGDSDCIVGGDSDCIVGGDSSLLKVLDYIYINLTLACFTLILSPKYFYFPRTLVT